MVQKNVAEAACDCKQNAFHASERIDKIRDKLKFISCFDWERSSDNEKASNGFSWLLDDIEDELKAISELLYPTNQNG